VSCSADRCKITKLKAKGLCRKHYLQDWRSKNRDLDLKYARDFYYRHYDRMIKKNRTKKVKDYKRKWLDKVKNTEEYRLKRKIKQAFFARTNKGRYVSLVNRSKSSGHELKITFNQYVKIIKNAKCIYCKGPLDKSGWALDRKNNNLGYVINNVVPSCGKCNRRKNKYMSYKEMLKFSESIKR